MSQNVIARRYAKALFNLAEKDNTHEALGGELLAIARIFENSSDLQTVLADTKISSLLKRDIVYKVLDRLAPSPLVRIFVQYLLSKKRMGLLTAIAAVFSRLVREKTGRLDAEITVARKLPQSAVSEITKQLSKYTGKDVHVSVKIDEAIIGGVVTRIGSTVIDGSLRHQLNRVYQSIISH